jgi:hypothetical protein
MSRTRVSLATSQQPKSKLLVRELRLVHMYCLSPRMLLCRDKTHSFVSQQRCGVDKQVSSSHGRIRRRSSARARGFGGSGDVSPELRQSALDFHACVVRRRLPHCLPTLPAHTPHCHTASSHCQLPLPASWACVADAQSPPCRPLAYFAAMLATTSSLNRPAVALLVLALPILKRFRLRLFLTQLWSCCTPRS